MKLSSNNFLGALTGVSFFLLASACGGKKEDLGKSAGRSRELSADAYIVNTSRFANNYTASGTLLPNEEVEIHPEMSGRVTGITFLEGSKVNKGQLLIQLYDADLRANLQKLQAQKKLQQTTAGRQKELLRIGGIAQQDYDATQTSISGINADIAMAEAAISKMQVVAPFSGVIGLRNISLGAIISPTTTIATLRQTGQLKMDFSVPDQYRNQIRNGQEVMFSVDGRLDTLTGKISAIESGADISSRMVKARALVPNDKGLLVAGAFAHVVIPFAAKDNAILIPSQAVIPTTKDKKVAVVRDGKVQMTVVKTGTRTEDSIEITDGLAVGDTILLTGLMQVKPDMDVKVRKIIK